MSNRQILVIGSQCDAIQPPLSFLPQIAQDLFRVMTDPEIGGCSASPSAGGLLIDPMVNETEKAIEEAFAAASSAQATLVLAFVGHGQSIGDDFYLLLRDSNAERVTGRTAIHLVSLIKEQYRNYSDLDGLVVLTDACYSGVGAADAAAKWVRELSGTLRFAMLTAAENRPAYKGCFTKTLVHCLDGGLDSVPGDFLRCEHVRGIIRKKCPLQDPQFPSFNMEFDDGLYLGKNRVRLRTTGGQPGDAGRVAEEIRRLTAHFQPTPILSQIVDRSMEARGLALIGAAGVGKSALAAALAYPEVTEGIVPAGFVQAAAFFPSGLIAGDLAQTLAVQLDRSVGGFDRAREQFERDLTEDQRQKLDRFQREVLGPLGRLTGDRVVRIVLDSLDQIPTAGAGIVQSAIDELAALPHVRLIVTARDDTNRPPGLLELPVDVVEKEHILSYLARRRVPEGLQQPIVDRAGGNWLIAKLLADRALIAPDIDPASLPAKLPPIYAQSLRRAGANTTERWREEFRPVLGVLAAAGAGPILPLKLLCAASGRLGGPDRPFRVRDRLVDLRGLVVRDRSGTEEEHVGLFHQTLVDYLLDQSNATFGIDPREPHGALAAAIAELAPAERHNPKDPVHHYASIREAEHLWMIGEYGRLIGVLSRRDSPVPAENLKRWVSWGRRIQEVRGLDHADTLACRRWIALWTGIAGDARQAVSLYQGLLGDQVRVLGARHPDVLETRHEIAVWTGVAGDARRAVSLFDELLPDRVDVLGLDHPDTLKTRYGLAAWTGVAGDARRAVSLLRKLLAVRIRTLGLNHFDTLKTRHDLAAWTGLAGDPREALRRFNELLPDRTEVLGLDHPDTLATRLDIAHWTGVAGDAREALRLFGLLLADQVRVLGPNHPDTLSARLHLAHWTGEAGDARAALRGFDELLPDQIRVLGADHPRTLSTRHDIAHYLGVAGDAQEAVRRLEELLPIRERILGAEHPDSLATRFQLAHWIGVSGDARGALDRLDVLRHEMSRVVGPDHPDMLETRYDIARWTEAIGDRRQALRLFEGLLPDRIRVLGPDHPDTRRTLVAIERSGQST